ncbi:MAG: hypothetical protein V4689_23435 [Verrucomicrobiota bacterium]
MKVLVALLALNLPLHVSAEDDVDRDRPVKGDEELVVQDPLIVRALARLEQRMEIRFNIPFPKNFDCDTYMRRPLAVIAVDGSKVCATRPIVNPYDQPRTVEWMIGPADPELLGKEELSCYLDLDEQGEFCRTSLIADWASDGTGNHQIQRGEGESGAVFFERARLTYQARARAAKDPATATRFLTAYLKMAAVIQALRKEESHPVQD